MTDWTPETNRIRTDMLTGVEKPLLQAAIKANGGEFFSNRGDGPVWITKTGSDDLLFPDEIYRAKLPPDADVVPWEATRENIIALIGEYLAEGNRLQQRPQPAATGAVTEPLRWTPKVTYQMGGAVCFEIKAEPAGEYVAYEDHVRAVAAAVAHAKRMVGVKGDTP